jgi:RHS repeat-associated protein
VTSLSEPSNAPQSRTYDSWGELKKVEWHPTSPEPVHGIEMTYDSLGRTLASYEENNYVLDPLTVNTYTYDTAAVSTRITPTYVLGRLAKASSPTEDIVFSYDELGNVNARSFTDLNDVDYVEQQGFHADGSQAWIQLQLPDNGYANERVEYDYDSASRLRWMWFSDDVNTQELYNADQLDAWGRVRSAMFGMTTYKADYAATGRRLPEQVIVSGSETRNITFGAFDAVGREVSRTEMIPNVGGTTTSTYDFLGRLGSRVRIAGGSTTQSWAFNYDPLGNITRLSDQLAGTHTTLLNSAIHSQADLDQVCAISWGGPLPGHCNVTHDSFGNMVSEPTPAGATTLSYFNSGDVHTISNSAGVTATFAYDPFGEVQDVNIGSPSSPLRHDQHYGDFITRRSQTGQSQSASFISRQFPGPGLTISRRGSQGPWVFKFSEPQGTRFTTDENGQFLQDVSYSPYGASTSSGASEGSSTFTPDQWNDGDALDSFGLVQLGKRIYDPAIGRFLSRDPLMIPRTSATTNPYAFAMNDPLNLSDPSGMDSCGQWNPCISTTTGGSTDAGSIAGLVATGIMIADRIFSTHANSGSQNGSPSIRQLTPHSAAFDTAPSRFRVLNQGAGRPPWFDAVANGFWSQLGDDAVALVRAGRHPIDTVLGVGTGLYGALSHPKDTARSVINGFKSDVAAIASGDGDAAGRTLASLVPDNSPPIGLTIPVPAHQIVAEWGAGMYHEGGFMTAIEHIMYRHSFESGFEGVSRFAEGTTARMIKRYVDEALRYGTVTQQGANGFGIVHTITDVGFNVAGQTAHQIQIYVRNGLIRTAYPF